MQIGPVQLIVVGFENDDNFRGQIVEELESVRGRGVIKIIDALFVHKDDAGDVSIIMDSDATEADLSAYGAALQRLLGLDGMNGSVPDVSPLTTDAAAGEAAFGITPAEVQAIVNELDPGTAVAFVLFEHVWAAGLAEAIREAGGHLLAQGILTRDAVMLMGAELAAMAEMEATIEAAEAIQGAMVLDTLLFVQELEEELEEEMAAAEAAAEMAALEDISAIDSVITTRVAAETLRNLVVAGVVDDTEIGTALTALIDSGLLNMEVVGAALDAAEAAQAEVEATIEAQTARGDSDA